MTAVIVADSGPIIHLSYIDQVHLLPALYGRIVVPKAVFDEVVIKGAGLPGSAELAHATWADIVEHDPDAPLFRGLLPTLQHGESAAISIAMTMGAELLLADDNRARATAKSLGLNVKGTLGLLILAKRQGRLDAVGPRLHALKGKGAWLSPEVMRRVLEEAGEAPP